MQKKQDHLDGISYWVYNASWWSEFLSGKIDWSISTNNAGTSWKAATKDTCDNDCDWRRQKYGHILPGSLLQNVFGEQQNSISWPKNGSGHGLKFVARHWLSLPQSHNGCSQKLFSQCWHGRLCNRWTTAYENFEIPWQTAGASNWLDSTARSYKENGHLCSTGYESLWKKEKRRISTVVLHVSKGLWHCRWTRYMSVVLLIDNTFEKGGKVVVTAWQVWKTVLDCMQKQSLFNVGRPSYRRV